MYQNELTLYFQSNDLGQNPVESSEMKKTDKNLVGEGKDEDEDSFKKSKSNLDILMNTNKTSLLTRKTRKEKSKYQRQK